MRKPRAGLLVPYVPFYESIVPIREEKLAFARVMEQRLAACTEVVSPGLVETEEAARSAAELFRERAVDAVVVVPSVAVFGALAWAALEALDIPICIWNSQPAEGIPQNYNIGELIRNSGGLGVQALANTLVRNGRKCRVVFSRAVDPLPAELLRFLTSARVAADLAKARFGRVGTVFPQMSDVQMEAGAWPGEAIVEVSAPELLRQYRQPTEEVLRERMSAMRRRHSVSELSDEELTRSARIWLALDAIVAQNLLDGGAFNCHGENCLRNPEIGVTGCYAVSAHTSQGRPFSCTGDLPTAIAMWLLEQLAGSVIYGELDLVDPEDDCVLLANGGEGHFGAAAGPVRITGNENFKGLHGRGASLSFEPFTGPATLASFTPLDASRGYRLIAAEGEMIPRRLLQITVFHSTFRFHGIRANAAFSRWCEAGAVHHVAIAPGHWLQELRTIAEMKAFDFISVGGGHEA